MIRDIIFDFDGTLVDSAPGIERALTAAWNGMFPEKPLPPVKTLLGPPIHKIFLGIDPHLSPSNLEQLISDYRRLYGSGFCLDAKPFPGCMEVLRELVSNQNRLYIATNKPARFTAKILAHLEMASLFTEAFSIDSRQPPFNGKAEMIRALISDRGLEKKTTVMIGDGLEDGTAAGECGIGFIAVQYGYGDICARLLPTGLFDLQAISDLPKRLATL